MSTLLNYGKQIRRARNDKGLTQEQLAEKLFVTKQAVSNWERGLNDVDDEIRSKLEHILGIRLCEPFIRKARNVMNLKPLDQIDNIEELMELSGRIIEATPVDMAYTSTVKKLLELTLDLVLGYEVYARSFERKQWAREHEASSLTPNELTWEDVSEDLFSIFDDKDPYPIQRKNTNGYEELYLQKINYMLHAVGSELFEDFDEEGYRNGYIQQVGGVAEEDAYALLSLLPDHENAIMTSYKASLYQMAKIIEEIVILERVNKQNSFE